MRKAAAYEAWRKKDVDTHLANFALVNRQNFIQEKDADRFAKNRSFAEAEGILLAAQKKLEELVKSETDTHNKINEAYAELGRLMKVHEDATAAYNKRSKRPGKELFNIFVWKWP